MIPEGQDAWPLIEAEIPSAWVEVKNLFMQPQPGFMALAKARYEQGQKEYAGTDGEWTTKPEDWFDNERYAELCDLVLYTAMRRVLHPEF